MVALIVLTTAAALTYACSVDANCPSGSWRTSAGNGVPKLGNVPPIPGLDRDRQQQSLMLTADPAAGIGPSTVTVQGYSPFDTEIVTFTVTVVAPLFRDGFE